VFIDGCFWHGCPLHSHIPKSNSEYWIKKLERNRDRDRLVDSLLKSNDWKAMRLWEHDLRSAGRVAQKIKRALMR
jgi:DNA mismatch endonuclease (patch repair protein)